MGSSLILAIFRQKPIGVFEQRRGINLFMFFSRKIVVASCVNISQNDRNKKMEFFLNVVVDDAGTTIGIYLFQLH